MTLVRKLLWIGGTLAWIVLLAVAGFWFRPVSYFNEGAYFHECLTGVASHSITLAGHRVHYLVEGPSGGPVVVFVHGLGGSAEDWRSLAPYLVKAGFRVYIPDLPGYGRSEKPADFSYSIPDTFLAARTWKSLLDTQAIVAITARSVGRFAFVIGVTVSRRGFF